MSALFFKYVFVILHIITAAGWFGLAMRVTGQARIFLNVDRGTASAFATETTKTIRLMSIFIVLTLVFALVAFFVGGGFAAYGPAYHTSILLILIMIGLQLGVIGPSWRKLRDGVTEGERVPAGKLASYRKRIAAGVGIGHLLWLIMLVLMFWTGIAASL